MNMIAILAGVLMARREGLTDPAAGIRSGIAASVLSGPSGVSASGLVVAQRIAQDEAAAQLAAAQPPPAPAPRTPPLEQRTVPNVSPVTAREAEAILGQAGLRVDVQLVDGTQRFPADMVIGQTPAAGTQVAPGTVITLQAASAAAQVSVDRVVGDPATEEATAARSGKR